MFCKDTQQKLENPQILSQEKNYLLMSYVSISNRIVDYIGQSAEIIIVDSQNIDSWLTNKYYCVDWKYSLSPTLQCQY